MPVKVSSLGRVAGKGRSLKGLRGVRRLGRSDSVEAKLSHRACPWRRCAAFAPHAGRSRGAGSSPSAPHRLVACVRAPAPATPRCRSRGRAWRRGGRCRMRAGDVPGQRSRVVWVLSLRSR
jgi:hypothetical protein